MPEHIRALIVILILSSMAFALIRKTAIQCIPETDFKSRRRAWYVITLLAFLSGNFWVFVLLASVFLMVTVRRDRNLVALYFFLLFTIPVASSDIPGFGLVNYFFSLSFQGLLAILILWRCYLSFSRQKGMLSFGQLVPDKILSAYLLLLISLSLRDTTFTDTLRQVLYLFLGAFLPYFVIARFVRNLEQFRDVMMSFVVALSLLAFIGLFEAVHHWLLYYAMIDAIGLDNGGLSAYLGRSGMLRAQATSGQSIVLGYLMVIAIGFFMYLQARLKNRKALWILMVGLIAALSRGPWIGMLVLILVYTIFGKLPVARLMRIGVIAVLLLLFASVMPGGQKVIDLLPYVGTVDEGNITYREKLAEKSITVIERNLFFGSATFMEAGEFDELKQSGGFIDFVNSYVGIALGSGIIGLSLFSGFFLWIMGGLVQSLKQIRDKESELYLLGRVLLATMVSMLVMIATVSSITFIPIVYWSVAGLCVAYTTMIGRNSRAIKSAR